MSEADVRAFHQESRRDVRAKRRQAQRTEGNLAASVAVAVAVWESQKADGVSFAERVAGLEQTVRAAWPFTREWKFQCPACDDLGLRIAECSGDASCGRSKPHLVHSYGMPCWCVLGKRFQEKRRPDPEDVLTQAAKVRQPTKFGR
jgi:hypothetical protein